MTVDEEYGVVESVVFGVSFGMRQKHIHAQSSHAFTKVSQPLAWFGRDPISPDDTLKPITRNGKFGRDHPIGALRSGDTRCIFEEATICINLSQDRGEMKQCNPKRLHVSSDQPPRALRSPPHNG